MKFTKLDEQKRHVDAVQEAPDAETMKSAAKNIKKWRKKFKSWRAGRAVKASPEASNFMGSKARQERH